MSSNGSYRYDYDVDLDELPALESIDGTEEMARVRRAEEVERFELGRTLTLIKLSSCFRNGFEPLFDVLSPILWDTILT